MDTKQRYLWKSATNLTSAMTILCSIIMCFKFILFNHDILHRKYKAQMENLPKLGSTTWTSGRKRAPGWLPWALGGTKKEEKAEITPFRRMISHPPALEGS